MADPERFCVRAHDTDPVVVLEVRPTQGLVALVPLDLHEALDLAARLQRTVEELERAR